MTNYKRISDEEVFNVIDKIDKNETYAISDYFKTSLLLMLDIRQFIRKMYSDLPKKARNIVTDPLKATKNDIVVGDKK